MTIFNRLFRRSEEVGEIDQGFYQKNSLIIRSILGVAVAAVLATLFFSAGGLSKISWQGSGRGTYGFVPDKVSLSAPIKITLPALVNADTAKEKITFNPALRGHWLKEGKALGMIPRAHAAENFSELYFQPDKPLELGHVYAATLAIEGGKEIRGQFMAAPDPAIIAILPGEGSEVAENSKISIVFNRPIVPLSTLDEMNSQSLPIEISPTTRGRFKWISSNTLQFIPETGLVRSSKYTVKVKSGIISLDGLPVEAKTQSFLTRSVRYRDDGSENSSQNISYKQAFRLYFNQAVDLERTRASIVVTNATTGKRVPVTFRYRSLSQQELKAEEPKKESGDSFGWLDSGKYLAALVDIKNIFAVNQVDQTVIEISGATDESGRTGFWDSGTTYRVSVNNVYPAEGNTNITKARDFSFSTNEIISRIDAYSASGKYIPQNSNLSRLTLVPVDPLGKIKITFTEPVNLAGTEISGTGVGELSYGKKCSGDSNVENCSKTDDHSVVLLSLKTDFYKPGESVSISLPKVTTEDGALVKSDLKINAKINTSTIVTDVKYRDINSIVLCSNNPLDEPSSDKYKSIIVSSLPLVVNNWERSYIFSDNGYSKNLCKKGQYVTDIGVDMSPNKSYNFTMGLTDIFGKTLTVQKTFLSGEMPVGSTNLYGLQPEYSVTVPDKTQVTFAAKNLTSVRVKVCKLGVVQLSKPYRSRGFDLDGCVFKVKTIDLPARFWVKNYFTINIKDYFPELLGYYSVTIENPRIYDTSGERIKTNEYVWNSGRLTTQLSVTSLSVVGKEVTPGTPGETGQSLTGEQLAGINNLYWVTDIKTQAPVGGATVQFYRDGKVVKEATTNELGVATINPIPGLEAVMVVNGNDRVVVSSGENRIEYVNDAYNVTSVFLYSDKPIYRPTQEVNLKGIYRLGYDGDYQIYQQKRPNLKVYNSKNDVIYEETLTLNEYGTFNTHFLLDRSAPLGNYSYCVSSNCKDFEVQEYVPAPFEVKVSTAKDEFVAGDKIDLNVDAHYYFGVPIENGQVEYTISSQFYYFNRYDYRDGYYNFSANNDDETDGRYYYGDKFVKRGTAKLNQDGKVMINEDEAIKKAIAESSNSQIIVVDMLVRNTNGQAISSQKSFVVHRGDYYLGVKVTPYFVAKEQTINYKVKSLDLNGKSVAKGGLKAEVFKIEWVSATREEAQGKEVSVSKKKKTLAITQNLRTDGQGDFAGTFSLPIEGEYELRISGKDGENLVEASTNLYVYGNQQIKIEPTDTTDLQLVPDREDLKVGEKGSFVIKSPYKNAKALITIERGRVFTYEIVSIEGSLYNYTFDVEPQYTPNIEASVVLLSGEPSMKYGYLEFRVNNEQKKILIETKTDRQTYQPRDKVTVDIFTRDYSGKPISAEVSLATVDLSVLALRGNPKQDPLNYFYQHFWPKVGTYANLLNFMHPVDISDKDEGGKGGGGDDTNKDKPRGIFKDVAYWNPVIKTDGEGRARVSFTLPDNLTTWRLETIGVTKKTEVGVGYSEFTTQKRLMVIPLKPRFVVPGDEFSVGAQIVNRDAGAGKAKVTFKSSTLLLDGGADTKTVDLQAGDIKTVYFSVKAPRNGQLEKMDFTFSAQLGVETDAVESSLAVRPDMTYETVATAGYSTDPSVTEIIYVPDTIISDQGEVKLKSSATLAVFLTDALTYLINYPYGCTEQIASQLESIAIVKKGLKLPNVGENLSLPKVTYQNQEYTVDDLIEIGLARIYGNQNSDGGFILWPTSSRDRSDVRATMAVVEGLVALKNAGEKISDPVLTRAGSYLLKVLQDSETCLYYCHLQPADQLDVIAVLDSLPEYKGDDYLNNLAKKIINAQSDGKKLGNTQLAQLSIFAHHNGYRDIYNKIDLIIDNRLTVDSRGAFIDQTKQNCPDCAVGMGYDSAVYNTATYLQSLLVRKSDSPELPNIIRWLIGAQRYDNSWGSTRDTLRVIAAFTDYQVWKKETSGSFNLQLALNDKTVGEMSFTATNILTSWTQSISTNQMKVGYNSLTFSKKDLNRNQSGFYYEMFWKYFLPAESVAARDEGFAVSRHFYSLADKENKNPLSEAKVGEVVREHLEIIVPVTRRYVSVEDYIPAGMEIVNLNLATEQKSLRFAEREITNTELRPDFNELRDDRAFLYVENLPAGSYEFDYFVRPLIPGSYIHRPAVVSEMYNPENFGRSSGGHWVIKP